MPAQRDPVVLSRRVWHLKALLRELAGAVEREAPALWRGGREGEAATERLMKAARHARRYGRRR
jgi:hypothetical protein